MILKRIGILFFVLGLAALLGPYFGFVLRGATPEQSQFGGGCMIGFGVLLYLAGLALHSVEKKQAARKTEKRKASRAQREADRAAQTGVDGPEQQPPQAS